MFTTRWSDASSSEDEANWPPPGRRRRHPAGNSNDNESAYSDGSNSCISKLLDSPGITFRDENKSFIRYFANDDYKQKDFLSDSRLGASTASSGFYSQPPAHSLGRMDSSYFPSPYRPEQPELSPDWLSRFDQFNLDPESPEHVTRSPSLPPSSPLMLRRFLSSQAPTSRTDCSYSCPSRRFNTSPDEDAFRTHTT
ncbi:hypothetical protein T265_06321 [Opisthorchis viverrini]|uniref:Uncharacterized protein n=1 Tax=Opisthorchis viverrini TaxID=6198 RepID=A0A074ZSQ2_OPIVI|nr:hypothetical protein T265_06321 [Opisthorchis viverrini]KER26400.1 hypothetical protein T265_06321 [Opisthorchis viverrini]